MAANTKLERPSNREEEEGDLVAHEGAEVREGWIVPVVHTSLNASLVTEHGGHRILLTIDHAHVETPPVEHLAFYIGLGALVGVGLVELPVAVALGIGHVMIELTRRPGLQALGRALEEA